MERTLLNRLSEANAAATLNTLRMATGQKINSPADDPATFVALAQLQSQLSTATATASNVTAASSLVTQTQTALGEIRTQLDTIRTELLTDVDQGLSEAERAAAQTAIDAAVSQINTLVGTDIDGRRVLDGSADYHVSGRDSSQVAEVRVHSIRGSSMIISGSVTAAATQAQLVYTGSGGKTTAAAVFTVTGELGSAEISVGNLEDLSAVATKINNQSYATGVTASVDGNELTLSSVECGSDVEIAVEVTDGTFAVTGGNGDGTADGTDAEVQINGQAVQSSNVDGNRVTVNSNGVHYEIEFVEGFSGAFDTMTVTGDALTFALSTSLDHRASLSIPALHAALLGGTSGSLDQIVSGGTVSGLNQNTAQAIRIVDEALAKLTRVEGSVDGFYNASISSASSILADLEEDLQAAIVTTDGYDEAEEYVLLVKNQALASNAIAGLAVLNQQRYSIVAMLPAIAGL